MTHSHGKGTSPIVCCRMLFLCPYKDFILQESRALTGRRKDLHCTRTQ